MKLKSNLAEKIAQSADTIQEHAERTGGPADLTLAFVESNKFAKFDADGSANYETGWLQGVADALETDPISLINLPDVADRRKRIAADQISH